MRNVISINALNNSICDLLGNIDDGSNAVVLEIKTDISKNPKLEINSRTVSIDADQFTYNIEESWYIGTGALQFRIVDDDHTGDYFSIAKIGAVNGNLFLKQNSNFSYTLSIISQPTGTPLTTDDIDSKLSSTSTNPVQNKIVTTELNKKLNSDDYKIDSAMSGASANPVQNKVIKQYIDNIGNRIVNVEKKIVADWVAVGNRVENVYVGYGHSILLGNLAGFVIMMLSNSMAVFQIYSDSSVKNAVNIQRTGTNAVSFTTTTEFNFVTMLSLKQN